MTRMKIWRETNEASQIITPCTAPLNSDTFRWFMLWVDEDKSPRYTFSLEGIKQGMRRLFTYGDQSSNWKVDT